MWSMGWRAESGRQAKKQVITKSTKGMFIVSVDHRGKSSNMVFSERSRKPSIKRKNMVMCPGTTAISMVQDSLEGALCQLSWDLDIWMEWKGSQMILGKEKRQ